MPAFMYAKSLQSCLTLCDPVDRSPPETRLICPWDSPGKNTAVGCHFLLQGDLPDPGIKTRFLVSPALAGVFLPLGPPGKAPQEQTVPQTYRFMEGFPEEVTGKLALEMDE